MATSSKKKMLPALDRRIAGPIHFHCTERYKKLKFWSFARVGHIDRHID